jgi:KDO2-lipid IV(A) lauroyltransferase
MRRKTAAARRFKKWVAYPLQALLVYALYGLFRILPTDTASAVGGWMGRIIGPCLLAHEKARRTLVTAMPDLPVAEQARILAGMWDNLGRVLAEYAHLGEFGPERVEVIGAEILEKIHAEGQPVLVISGHFANWEVIPVTSVRYGLEPQLVYRPANNPYVDRLLSRVRQPMGKRLARKGTEGARSVQAALKSGQAVGMLVDQKHNKGIAVPFFGREAMTAPAVALLALHYKAPIVMVRCERLAGAHFRLTVCPPLAMPEGMTREESVKDILVRINRQLEEWIRERPEQWLWLHRRWSEMKQEEERDGHG